jgi:hypothetical protein
MGINVRRIDRVTGQFGYGGDQIRRNNRNIFEPSLNSGHKKNRGGKYGSWVKTLHHHIMLDTFCLCDFKEKIFPK